MSFQAYLDNIRAKTGKSADDFKILAEKKGLLKPETKAGEVVAWLKKDFDLGHGHAMAIYTVFKGLKEQKQDKPGIIDKHFSGKKINWKPVYELVLKKISTFGNDIYIDPAVSYISILRGKKKFAIVQIKTDRINLGIKLKEKKFSVRFQDAALWNTMVTHKTEIRSIEEVNSELVNCLKEAYVKSL